MAVDFVYKDKYGIDDLLEIMRILRAPGGCPWDAEQTHKSIKKDFIEETYEVIEAINKDDKTLLQEELGDVLMQVVFHSQIETEQGSFRFEDVADGICKKLIERHPHVFSDVRVNGSEEVLSNWDTIKRKSKHQDTFSSAMDAVPRELPALMRCNKILGKAKRAGYEQDDSAEALRCLKASSDKLSESLDDMENAVGELLLNAVNFARIAGVDPEEALTCVTDKYISEFKAFEAESSEKN